jgi:hypothetical protein
MPVPALASPKRSGPIVSDDILAERPLMRPAVPISVQRWTRTLNRWDAPAFLLVLGVLIFFAVASGGLLEPLAELQESPLSLAPASMPPAPPCGCLPRSSSHCCLRSATQRLPPRAGVLSCC